MPHDLQQMREHPGNVKKRDLVAALKENGWTLVRRSGSHEAWVKPGNRLIMVPRTLHGTGTIRHIVEQIIEGER